MPHGPIERVADDVFWVRGSIGLGPGLRITRNMAIVRSGDELTLVHSEPSYAVEFLQAFIDSYLEQRNLIFAQRALPNFVPAIGTKAMRRSIEARLPLQGVS